MRATAKMFDIASNTHTKNFVVRVVKNKKLKIGALGISFSEFASVITESYIIVHLMYGPEGNS